MCFGGSTNTVTSQGPITYAPYIQSAHNWLIQLASSWMNDTLLNEIGWSAAQPNSNWVYTGNVTGGNWSSTAPYNNYVIPDPAVAFFGTGNSIATYESLFEAFENYVAGIDLSNLFQGILQEMNSSPAVLQAIQNNASELLDEINTVSLPKMRTGLRDINAVQSSTFILAQALIETERLSDVSDYAAKVNLDMTKLAVDRWVKTLDWQLNSATQYANIHKMYWTIEFDYLNVKSEMDTKTILWPFTVIDNARAIVAALNGAYGASMKGEQRQASTGAALSNVLGLASAFTTPMGIGGASGIGGSLGGALFSQISGLFGGGGAGAASLIGTLV